jgi:hypothetical protein
MRIMGGIFIISMEEVDEMVLKSYFSYLKIYIEFLIRRIKRPSTNNKRFFLL